MVFLSLFIPSIKEKIAEKFREVHVGTYVKDEHCIDSIYTAAIFKQMLRARYKDIFKTARLHGKAPNAEVVELSNLTRAKLLDLQKCGRPLVINFGSCTWPPFMSKLEQFNSLIARFSNHADFVIIYIEEAHPDDGWKFKDNFKINRHKLLEDRITAAKELQRHKPKCPIYVDTMKDEANRRYGGLYERLYIVLDGFIVYQGERGPEGYHLEEVESWLESHHG